jgi:hypothetical protein
MIKKDTLKISLLLFATAILVAGCNSEYESPFAGKDNYIATFTLEQNGVTLNGAVSSEAITITAPERFSLSGAKATVRLSENATISPDPATITDWDATQTFTVTSYNGAKHSYAYSVERHLVSRDGDVTLLTQADVNEFATAVKDVDQIVGSITIGAATGKTAEDTITSLAGLEHLKIVTGVVAVNATYGGEELTAFENLEIAGGLTVAAKKTKVIRFPKLTAIRASLDFDRIIAVEHFDFPELTEVDKEFRMVYADSLKSMNFPKLQHVRENLTIQGHYGGSHKKESVDLPALKNVGGTLLIYYWQGVATLTLPELASVGGDFTVNNMDKLENIILPKLETVGGHLSSITNSPALASMQFPALKSVEGNLTIPNAANLATLDFPTLKYIKGELSIQLRSLTSLDAFDAVESIGGRLYLYSLANLRSIAMPSLKKVGTIYAYGLTNVAEIDVRGMEVGLLTLYLSAQTGLTLIGDDEFSGKLYFGTSPSDVTEFPITVQGFRKVGGMEISASSYCTALELTWIEEVAGLLNFSSGSAVRQLSLPNLKSAGGVQLSYCNSLETLNLPNLETITGYVSGTTAAGGFAYGVSSDIASLTLPKLKSVTGNVSIIGLTAARPLATISFPELQSLTGTLTVTGTNNAVFKDLTGFSKLSSAAGVTISGFTQLNDFSPLKGVIPSLSADTWKISGCGYNPSYQDMLN